MRKRVHDKAWREFVRWCRGRGLRPMPANAWTVSAYLRWCERHHRTLNTGQHVKAISRAHLLNCLRSPDSHPMVARTLRMIEARDRSRPSHSDLFSAEDFLGDDAGDAGAEPPDEDKKSPTKKQAKKQSQKRVRSLRSTPRLVSRRS